MATGGKYSRSFEIGSEPYFDFSCSPCGKDGTHVEAVKGCYDCGQNFCAVCLQHHNKFEGMKRHRILDKTQMMSSSLMSPASLPMERCSIHPGKDVELYCGIHDTVCCVLCIAVDHRSCQDVDDLPKAAKGIKQSPEVQEVNNGIKRTKKKLAEVKRVREVDLERIEKEKHTSLVDIDNFRDNVVKHLDSMVEKAKNEVRSIHSELGRKINADINTIQELDTTLETNAKHLEAYQVDSEAEVFVHVKQGKRITADGNKLLHEMESNVLKESLKFFIDTNIAEYFMNLKSIGNIHEKETKPRKPISSANLNGEFNVKVSGDAYTCHITGVCLLQDGSMMLTDLPNKRLKRLDKSYQVVDHCAMPGRPWGVCSTRPNEVAVALYDDKKIQLVCTTGKLIITKSFNVNGKCRDVAFSKGEVFVSIRTPKPQVCVYSLSGDHLRTFLNNSAGQPIFSRPLQIIPSNDGTKLHIADADKGVITTDRQGNQQSIFTDPQLNTAWGVCVLENDNLLVSGQESHNIIQVDGQGRKINVLLSETDGLKHPDVLSYDQDNSRLIVTMMTADHIKVFNLTRK